MVCDNTVRIDMDKEKEQQKNLLNKIRQTIARPSVSALMYGYLKEKDVNLKDMSVDEWKKMEMDLVEIVLSEVYPGEDVPENQLNFTALARSIAFMSNFIETLNKNLESAESAEKDGAPSPPSPKKDDDGPNFEV